MHDKFEVALTHLEKESGEKDAELARLEAEREEREGEVEGANREMERLSTRVWELEDELERTTERLEREVGEVLDKAQADEQMTDALKEVCPLRSTFLVIRRALTNAIFVSPRRNSPKPNLSSARRSSNSRLHKTQHMLTTLAKKSLHTTLRRWHKLGKRNAPREQRGIRTFVSLVTSSWMQRTR